MKQDVHSWNAAVASGHIADQWCVHYSCMLSKSSATATRCQKQTQRIPASDPLQQRKDVVLLLMLLMMMKVNNPAFSSSTHAFLQISSSVGIVSQNRGPRTAIFLDPIQQVSLFS